MRNKGKHVTPEPAGTLTHGIPVYVPPRDGGLRRDGKGGGERVFGRGLRGARQGAG